LTDPWLDEKRKKTQISKTRNAKEEITTNIVETQGIIRDYFENLFSNKFENLEESDKLLDTYDHPKLNQEDVNHLSRSIKQNEIEAAIESPKNEKSKT
jgi:hypothetical protein